MSNQVPSESKMPEWLDKLMNILFRRIFEIIERDQLNTRDAWTSERSQWHELREQVKTALREAGYDADVIMLAFHTQFDIKDEILFLCPQCQSPHSEDNHCFDCTQCHEHCNCPHWLEMAAEQTEIQEGLENPCNACGGTLEYLGSLGKLRHFRCRNCKMDCHKPKATHQVNPKTG
jgi:hypothetical protein